nr:ABC transporter ATP-binding protein [Microbacterium sp. NC79]
MIVADNAHVVYKVFAGGKPIGGQGKIFGQRSALTNEVHAVRGVSFTAREGETIGVIGHNGSGKSTLFRAMAGLIPTSQGSIYAADRPVLLGVNAALMPELSGENNIKLGLLAMGFTAEEAAAQVNEIADFAELNEFINHPMRTYSSGMGARLRFAIASARPHSILLLDEALAVGDRRFRMKSEARIRSLRDAAGLVMIVSHSPSSLKETCERGLWIHKGELRADGPIKDVIGEYSQWAKDPKSVGVGAAADAVAAAERRKRVAARIARKEAAAAKQAALDAKVPQKEQAVASTAAFVETPPAPVTSTKEPVTAPRVQSASKDKVPATPSEAPVRPVTTTPQAPSPRRTATAAVPIPGSVSPRDAARRQRFRESAHNRNRRRTRAIVLSSAAVVMAVAAGAAITFITLQSDRTEIAELRAADRNTPQPSVTPLLPVINAFIAPPTVLCAEAGTVIDVALSWDATGVTGVNLATTGDDGIAVPVGDTFGPVVEAQTVPYVCSNAAQVFTLFAVSESGQQISATATVTRELLATEEPVEEQPAEPPTDVEPAPEPTEPAPQPTEPAPEPTVPVPEPEPTEPAPEPTEPAPEPTEPAPEPEPTASAEPAPEVPPAADPVVPDPTVP